MAWNVERAIEREGIVERYQLLCHLGVSRACENAKELWIEGRSVWKFEICSKNRQSQLRKNRNSNPSVCLSGELMRYRKASNDENAMIRSILTCRKMERVTCSTLKEFVCGLRRPPAASATQTICLCVCLSACLPVVIELDWTLVNWPVDIRAYT
jgi:hypothetical protein